MLIDRPPRRESAFRNFRNEGPETYPPPPVHRKSAVVLGFAGDLKVQSRLFLRKASGVITSQASGNAARTRLGCSEATDRSSTGESFADAASLSMQVSAN